MLTYKEIEQITWAIKCMGAVEIENSLLVSRTNVLGLLERFSERTNKEWEKDDEI